MNVLVAEDDFRVAEIHCQYLRKLDEVTNVEWTANAMDTLEKLKVYQVDILLLDVYLPDYLGVDMIETYKKVNNDLQIILITAATDMEILKKAYGSGVVDYLVKPIELERLGIAVRKAYNERKLLQKKGAITQQLVDKLFQPNYPHFNKKNELPKGIDELTLEKVRETLKSVKKGMAAEEVGKLIGVSRTTARRYLEYLISVEEAKAELEYGIVGRPERKYVLMDGIES